MIKLRKRLLGSDRVHDGWDVYEGDICLGWVVKTRDGLWNAFVSTGRVIGRQVGWGIHPRRVAVAEVVINRQVWQADQRCPVCRTTTPMDGKRVGEHQTPLGYECYGSGMALNLRRPR